MTQWHSTTNKQRDPQDIIPIVEKYTNLPADVIDSISNEWHETNSALQTNSFDNIIAVNQYTRFLNMYCTKTGQRVHARSDHEIIMMHNAHGVDRATYYFERQQLNTVAPHWIYTDGESLENLFKTDPHGYFVYALFLVLPQCRTPNITENRMDYKEIFQTDLSMRIDTYYNIINCDISTIVETNELMRRYLSIINSLRAKKHLAFDVEKLPAMFCADDSDLYDLQMALIQSMQNIIEHEYMNNNIRFISYSTALELTTIYDGHSNFIHQRKLRQRTQLEEVQELWQAMQLDFGLPHPIEHEIDPKVKAVEGKPLTNTKIEFNADTYLTSKPKQGINIKSKTQATAPKSLFAMINKEN